MAFFDNLGKKITHAGQSAVQKTKDVTDLARLNGLITDEEKLIGQHYFQMGKLYFELHSNDCEAQFADLIRMITDSQAKINDLRRQIQDIKGVVRCERCGAEVAQNSSFCNICGAPIPKPQPPAGMMQCAACGKVIPEGSRFCVYCGTPVEVVPAANTENMQNTESFENVQTAETVENAENAQFFYQGDFTQGGFNQNEFVQQPQPKTCPNCGSVVEDGMAFCTMCGTKL